MGKIKPGHNKLMRVSRHTQNHPFVSADAFLVLRIGPRLADTSSAWAEDLNSRDPVRGELLDVYSARSGYVLSPRR
jgi:hypothetical protein